MTRGLRFSGTIGGGWTMKCWRKSCIWDDKASNLISTFASCSTKFVLTTINISSMIGYDVSVLETVDSGWFPSYTSFSMVTSSSVGDMRVVDSSILFFSACLFINLSTFLRMTSGVAFFNLTINLSNSGVLGKLGRSHYPMSYGSLKKAALLSSKW